MDPNFRLRNANIHDFAELADLQIRASLTGYPPETLSVLRLVPRATQDNLAHLWEAGYLFVVAQNGDAIVGFGTAILEHDSSDAELDGLFVDPSLWKRGIGRGILNKIVTDMIERGAARLFATVNPLARSFYEACAFEFFEMIPMRNISAAPRLVRLLPSGSTNNKRPSR